MNSRLWSHDLCALKTKMLFYTCHALIIKVWGNVAVRVVNVVIVVNVVYSQYRTVNVVDTANT